MFEKLFQLFSRQSLDTETLFALSWKKPDRIEVVIRETKKGYFAKVTSFQDDNIVTQASTGQELIEMVNEAIYDYLDIPEQYRPKLGYFLPPEELREQLKARIPEKYLDTAIGLARA